MENIRYVQQVYMSDKELFDMYIKMDKEEIVKMLIESNKHLEKQTAYYPIYPTSPLIGDVIYSTTNDSK